MKPVKILLVDDEPDVLEFLSFNLKKESFSIESCNNGKEAVYKALVFKPDLILMDVMMPLMDGIEACEEIRSYEELRSVIIVFLSARNEDYSIIAGLNAGADDYITKPVKPKMLISKINSLLRRRNGFIQKENSSEPNKKKRNVVIDKDRYVVIKDAEEYSLPRKEFELISLLADNPNKLFTRDEILKRVWGDDIFISDRTIDVHIRRIRKRIGKDVIKTVKGVGYRFFSD